MAWTDEQLDFIGSKNGPVLVSAAAGSGKTSAIVERVITRLSDAENPLLPEKLLMTTFSNAAANEMLSRIETALQKKADAEPENKFLLNQCEKMNEAQIGTIHAFCLKIIRENFSQLDLSCDFRIPDEVEKIILMKTAAEIAVRKCYDKNDKEFYALIENVCDSKSDRALNELVIKIYNAVIAMPFPEDVVELWVSNFTPTPENYKKTLEPFCEQALSVVRHAKKMCEQHADEVSDPIGAEFFRNDAVKFENIEAVLLQGEIEKAIPLLREARLLNKPFPKLEDELAKYIKDSRANVRSWIDGVIALVSDVCYEKYCEEQNRLRPVAQRLFEIVLDFMAEFSALKREKNLVDFSDAEQFMLKLLWKKEDGRPVVTDIAKSLSKKYEEIYIDEYQDVNAAQEMIFKAISPQKTFMVGDVKQSIYGFRHADADIFERKRRSFCNFDGVNFPATIFFDKNFRSRKSVTEFINQVFFKTMVDGVGAGVYTDKDKLDAQKYYPATDGEGVSFIFREMPSGSNAEACAEEEYIIVANEIEKLVKSGYKVSDGKDGLRNCRYSDFCIICRADTGKFLGYYEALQNFGIECAFEKGGGEFLKKREISMVYSILKAVNNPFDDISLCAAMMSPVFLFTPADLARIRTNREKYGEELYSSVKRKASEGDEKCINLLATLKELSYLAAGQSVDSLLSTLYDRYGIYHFVGAMTLGDERMNNLDIFRYYARSFENNGYKGLGEFIRFVDKIAENDGKLTSAGALVESRNAVTIMTAHKSKGLEYPICIIGNSLKKYNDMDLRASTIVGKDCGFACRINNVDENMKYTPISFKSAKTRLANKQNAEELRLLYVALTRAKERLIIPIVTTKIGDKLKNANLERQVEGSPAPVMQMKNWGSLMLYASAKAHNMKPAFMEYGAEGEFSDDMRFDTYFVDEAESGEKAEEIERADSDQEIIREIARLSCYKYPYPEQSCLPSKFSVSELSKGSAESYDFLSEPDFMQNQEMTGAQRGSALHTFMQFADYENARDNLRQEIENVYNKGFITEKQKSVINEKKLEEFFSSALAKRILTADDVLREYKFMTGINSKEFGGNVFADDTVVLQGVADCVIVEGGFVTIIDYKTDYVKEESELVEKYGMQLAMYRQAIEKLVDLPVKECLIYSFHLGKQIEVKTEESVF